MDTVERVRAVAAFVLLAIGVATLPGAHAIAEAAACTDGPTAGRPMPGTTAAGVTRVDDVFAHRVAGRCRVLVTQVRFPTGVAMSLPLLLAVHIGYHHSRDAYPQLAGRSGSSPCAASGTHRPLQRDVKSP